MGIWIQEEKGDVRGWVDLVKLAPLASCYRASTARGGSLDILV